MKTTALSNMALGLFLCICALAAQAVPITYTLTGVTFTDGTSATGSFTFDADTKKSSGYSILTMPGILSAFNWNPSNSGLYYGGGAGPNNFTLITLTGNRVFNFSFVNPLTNAGGTDPINFASTYECNNCGTYRRVNAGSVTSVNVPEPGTLALLLPVLAGIAYTTRRRQQRQA
jgi:hypothetical protein